MERPQSYNHTRQKTCVVLGDATLQQKVMVVHLLCTLRDDAHSAPRRLIELCTESETKIIYGNIVMKLLEAGQVHRDTKMLLKILLTCKD